MPTVGYDSVRGIFRDLPFLRHENNIKPTLALGPCAIENEDIVTSIAESVAKVEADYLRGGAIKLRTRIGSFEGLGPDGWKLLRKAANKFGLKTVSEITDHSDIRYAINYLDMLQIGARSMWNFRLLKECAATDLPIMLKRGLGATTFDWFSTAERLISYGCKKIIMCERGIASIDPLSRNCIDLSTLLFLLRESPLPIWVDVSHTSGDPRVALDLLNVCKLLKVDGIMAEVHSDPSIAKCDAAQAIPTELLLAS
jgi:3-deoxy-7-phosphoheptulonate synthase/chorismate mutase